MHRSFGLVIDLDPTSPWQIVRQGDPGVPYSLWPRRIDGPLDLDGDGTIEEDELTSYEVPTARLVSRTSTAVRVDVQVEIASRDRADVPVDRMLRARQAGGTSRIVRRTVAPGYETWVGRCPDCKAPDDRLVAMVDHAGFQAEAGRRRQIITFELFAPSIGKDEAQMLNDVLDRVVLGRRADPSMDAAR